MSDYVSNASLESIAAVLLAANRIAVLTHTKPDGDAIGSVIALVRCLNAKGNDVQGYLAEPVAANLRSLIGESPVHVLREGELPAGSFDAVIVVDTGAWSQVEPVADWLRERYERVIGIDHHANGDDIASKRVIDTSCAATTQLIVDLLAAMDCPMTGGPDGIAEPLFVGLATDTGWFRHSNADSRVFAVASKLLSCGVDKSRLHQIVEEDYAPSRLALQARALGSLELVRGGTVAIQQLTKRDFEESGGATEDITGLVNEPLCVGSVRVSVMLVEVEPGQTKLSFRSKPGAPELGYPRAVDVNRLAGKFGGGGHIHAAGAKVDAPLAEARARLIQALTETMNDPS